MIQFECYFCSAFLGCIWYIDSMIWRKGNWISRRKCKAAYELHDMQLLSYIMIDPGSILNMPRRGSILDSRSDRSTSRSDRSTSSKSFQTPSRRNNKGATFQQPVYQNSKEYYIPTLGSTHPPQHDYGRVDAYQLCEGFRFQDLLQTQ